MRAASRLPVALLIAAAAASAALSHWVIDVVADYVVAHASFDDVGSHGSRGLIAAIAIAAALAIAVRIVQRCFDAASDRGVDLPAPPSWRKLLPFAVIAILATVCAVPVMEYVDARLAGETIDGLADAFGGSILLGISTSVLCAAAVATGLFALVRWLLSYRDRIVAAIMSVIRRVFTHVADSQRLRRSRRVSFSQPRPATLARGERAPPRDALVSTLNALRASRGIVCFTHSLRRAASFQGTSRRHPALL